MIRSSLLALVVAFSCTSAPPSPTSSAVANLSPGPTSTPAPTATASATPTVDPRRTIAPGRVQIAGVAAWDAETAWATMTDGSTPFVLLTRDAGVSWQRLAAPANVIAIGALRFVTPKDGWLLAKYAGAAGNCNTLVPPTPCDAVVFHTSDGGSSWTPQTSEPYVRHAPGSGFSNLVVVDARDAWVTTTRACTDPNCPTDVVATSDGRSWSVRSTIPKTVTALDFVDAAFGWATTFSPSSTTSPGRSDVYRTLDGGRTWTPLFHADGTAPRLDVTFVDRSHGWMLGYDPGVACGMGGCSDYTLYATSDGGDHWSVVRSPDTDRFWWMLAPSSGAGFLGPPHFASASEGWIGISASAGAASGGMIHTRDGGRTWTRSGDPTWSVNSIDIVVPRDRGAEWALVGLNEEARSPVLVRSTDGDTWAVVLMSAPLAR